jgi:phospholipase/carboxylesterase
MPPFANPRPVKLDDLPVLIVSGARDPIIQPETAAKLALLLKLDGATVEHRVLPAGPELSEADIAVAQGWWHRHALAKVNGQ